MSKSQEIEIELTVYIEECLRLRAQLEQVLMERSVLMQQQDIQGNQMSQQRNLEELANLEEAFRYQEMELQKERDNTNAIQMQMMKMQETIDKLKDKDSKNKGKVKKIHDLNNQNKRQGSLLDQRVRECNQLKADMAQLQQKLQERERVHGQNKDLVTKNCAQQSTI